MTPHRNPDETTVPFRPAELYVKTGRLGDARRALRGNGHKADRACYQLALHAWRYQDTWDLDEHRSFWTGLDAIWPPANGRRRHDDERAALAGILISIGIAESEVPRLLGIEADTMRRYDTLAIAREIFERTDGDDHPPLPRVYAIGEAVPRGRRVNVPYHGALSSAVARALEDLRRRHPVVDLLYVACGRQLTANLEARANGR